jgi:hypothetical protein
VTHITNSTKQREPLASLPREANAIFWTAAVITLILLSGAAWMLHRYTLAELEPIGAFITGIGQMIALVWIIVTFRSQLRDIALQRQELAQQRTAQQDVALYTQQGLSLELYKYEKRRLDVIAKSLLTCGGLTVDALADLSAMYANGNDDAYLECLSRSDELQRKIRDQLRTGNQLIYSYLKDYDSIYRTSVKRLGDLDSAGYIRNALISESCVQEVAIIGRAMLEMYAESDGIDDGDN